MKTDTEIDKADEAFERFYIELVYKFPFALEYMKDMLHIVWVAGATWGIKDGTQRIEDIFEWKDYFAYCSVMLMFSKQAHFNTLAWVTMENIMKLMLVNDAENPWNQTR